VCTITSLVTRTQSVSDRPCTYSYSYHAPWSCSSHFESVVRAAPSSRNRWSGLRHLHTGFRGSCWQLSPHETDTSRNNCTWRACHLKCRHSEDRSRHTVREYSDRTRHTSVIGVEGRWALFGPTHPNRLDHPKRDRLSLWRLIQRWRGWRLIQRWGWTFQKLLCVGIGEAYFLWFLWAIQKATNFNFLYNKNVGLLDSTFYIIKMLAYWTQLFI